jgi:hypothetical protein
MGDARDNAKKKKAVEKKGKAAVKAAPAPPAKTEAKTGKK